MSRGSPQVYVSWRALILISYQLNHIINTETGTSSYFPVFQVLITTIQGQLNQQIQRNLLRQSWVRTISTYILILISYQLNHIINTEMVAYLINTSYETVTVRIVSSSMYSTTNTIKHLAHYILGLTNCMQKTIKDHTVHQVDTASGVTMSCLHACLIDWSMVIIQNKNCCKLIFIFTSSHWKNIQMNIFMFPQSTKFFK